MKYHYDVEQRTDEWHALRLGRITGTSFTTLANGKPATIETLCEKTAAERITGLSSDSNYMNDAMERGIALEEQARELYQIETMSTVQTVGFLELDEFIGCSPDGLVGDDGMIEIKVPEPHTHLRYCLAGQKAWTKYRWQIRGGLMCAGRKWAHFVSYSPDFPPKQQLVIVRVEPTREDTQKLISGAAFCRKRIAELSRQFDLTCRRGPVE